MFKLRLQPSELTGGPATLPDTSTEFVNLEEAIAAVAEDPDSVIEDTETGEARTAKAWFTWLLTWL